MKALAIDGAGADFGIDQTRQYALDAVRRWDADLASSAAIAAGDIVIVPARSRSPRTALPFAAPVV